MANEVQDQILPLLKLKELLGHCVTEPLGCAFGLTKDKKDCLLLVDKRSKPKKVATMMKAAGKNLLDAPTVRFGRVTVDAENDPGTLRFTVNRSEAGGTIVTLNKLAKRAGYSAILINADPSLENEAEELAAPPAPPPPAAAEPPADPAALKARLGDLVKQMMARLPKDPNNQEQMTKLAKTANIQLATNNFKTAVALMDGLEKMLQAPLPPGNEEMDKVRKARQGLAAALDAAKAASATLAATIEGEDKALEAAIQAGDTAVARERLFELVALSKQGGGGQADGNKAGIRLAEALITWNRARSYVGQQVTVLQREIVAQTQDEDDAEEIASNVGMLDRLMDVLDDSLSDKLSEIRAAADPAQKAALANQAKSIVASFQQRVASDRLINIIDDNGFIPMDIKPTVTAALADVMASI